MSHDETLPSTDSVFGYAPVVRPFDPEETWANRMDDFPWRLWKECPGALRVIGDGPVHAPARITTEHRELLQGPILSFSLARAQLLLSFGLAVAERIKQGLIVFDCDNLRFKCYLDECEANIEPFPRMPCFSSNVIYLLQELAYVMGEPEATHLHSLQIMRLGYSEKFGDFSSFQEAMDAKSEDWKGMFDRLYFRLENKRKFLGPRITIRELVRPGAQVYPQPEPSSRPPLAFKADSREWFESVLEIAAQMKAGLKNNQPPDPFIVRNQLKRAIISALRFEEHPEIPTPDLNLCMEVRRQCRSTIMAAAIWLDLPPQPLFDNIEQAESLAWSRFVSRASLARMSRKIERASTRAHPQSNAPEDGPELPNSIRWQDQAHSISPREWRLLNLMWDRQNASVDEAVEAVWGYDETKDEGQLRKVTSKLSKALLAIDPKLQAGNSLSVKSGYVVKASP